MNTIIKLRWILIVAVVLLLALVAVLLSLNSKQMSQPNNTTLVFSAEVAGDGR